MVNFLITTAFQSEVLLRVRHLLESGAYSELGASCAAISRGWHLLVVRLLLKEMQCV